MSIVSVSMPDELIDRLDEFADDHEYSGRSEVVRESARTLLGEFENERLEDQQVASVVTALFDYEPSRVEQQLLNLRHEHDEIVVSNNHNHVHEDYCMEVFILDGTIDDISTFIRKTRAVSNVHSVEYLFVPTNDLASITAESERSLVR